MALGDSLRGLFTNNPVNRVGPTGEPNIGGSNVTDLIGRSVGGLLGRDMRTEAAKLTEGIQGIAQDDPDRLRKMVELQLQSAVSAGDRPAAAQYANTLERIREQETTAAKLATPKVVGSQTQFYKDSKGNRFARVMEVDSFGTASFKIQPIGDSPEEPVGVLQATTDGSTLEEQLAQAGRLAETEAYNKRLGETFADKEESILAAGTAAVNELPALDKVLAIVDDPDFTSGGIPSLVSKGKQFFGIETADIGTFNKATADILLKALDNFKGAISEGERIYLKENLANLGQSKAINRALIRDARDILERARQRAEHYVSEKESGKQWRSDTWFKYVNEEYKDGYKGRADDVIESTGSVDLQTVANGNETAPTQTSSKGQMRRRGSQDNVIDFNELPTQR